MADFEPTYEVFSRGDCGGTQTHYVITKDRRGVEFICTQFTHDKFDLDRPSDQCAMYPSSLTSVGLIASLNELGSNKAGP